jgi:hypothetical protein
MAVKVKEHIDKKKPTSERKYVSREKFTLIFYAFAGFRNKDRLPFFLCGFLLLCYSCSLT